MRRLAAMITVGLVLTAVATASTYKYPPRPGWLPKLYWAVGMCETQLNWRHNSGTYQGAFGFYYGAWDQYRYPGYPSEAYNATPWQQYRVIRRIGMGGNGCYQNGGYLYWMGRAP
jgi:hypothetical protein